MIRYFLVLLVSLICVQLRAQAIEGRLLGTWSDSSLVGSTIFDNTYNEIWGYVADGKEYAILGSTKGTHIIDVSDATSPEEVLFVRGGTSSPEIIHRDYHDHNGFLYAVADEGFQSALQVMDLSFLPDSIPVVYDSNQFIRRTHNIFIDQDAEIMYCCFSDGADLPRVPLRLFDISDPYEPSVIDEYYNIDGFELTQVHDAFVRNDTAYLNCGPEGFVIADFSDPLFPVGLGSLSTNDYPQSGYNHSGWLSENGNTYYMADENHGMDLKVLDVRQLPDLPVIGLINADSPSSLSIPHNQIVADGYLYSSYYYDGLQVWDVNDPENISRVMHYPTSTLTHRPTYEGAWGVYPFLPSGNILVSDMQEGLFIIDSVSNTLSSTEEVIPDTAWEIFPNPSDGAFSIKLTDEMENNKIEIFTQDGKLLQNLKLENSLDLLPGTYSVKISGKKSSGTKTLIIAQ